MFALRSRSVAFIPRTSGPGLIWRTYSTAPTREAYLERLTDAGSEGIVFLTLNRPAAKNALSMEMLRELRAALEEIKFDGITRAVIVQSSTPSIFCAGADLKQRRSMTPVEVSKFLYQLRLMLGELSSLPVPTICALDGAALGGGLELALACDMRVAGAGANKLGLPETRLAVIPGAGGTQRLSRLLGPSRAKEMIFTSKILTAAQALEIGLVNHLAADGQTASERAIILAREVLPSGPLAIAGAKLAIDGGLQMDLESGLDFEQQCYAPILKSADRLEGLKAFAEKRKPVYRGE